MTIMVSIYMLGVILFLVARRQPLARVFDPDVARRLIHANDPAREDVVVMDDDGLEEARRWLAARRDAA